MASRLKKRKRSEISAPRTGPRDEVREKLIVMLFLVFVILAITVLFEGAPYTIPEQEAGKFTSAATIETDMPATGYLRNSRFNGSVSLTLQEGDLLPPNTEILFLISSNKTNNCSKYVCDNNVVVDWYRYNNATNEC
ncbi:MAG: hypothetical protein K6T16_00890, partial [Candidatus Pacearchaeota archaeon]|nr:hypothetical protein [Candidatus Pacearchaeota archaeon]